EDAAVDRREADRVEAALLALGDEEAVDAEHGGGEEGRREDAGGAAAGEVAVVEAEAEDDEGADREERHRGQRLERAELGPQVLGEDRGEGGAGRGHVLAAISSMPSVSTLSASGRWRSGSWVTTTRVWRPGAVSGFAISPPGVARVESGSPSRSR